MKFQRCNWKTRNTGEENQDILILFLSERKHYETKQQLEKLELSYQRLGERKQKEIKKVRKQKKRKMGLKKKKMLEKNNKR